MSPFARIPHRIALVLVLPLVLGLTNAADAAPNAKPLKLCVDSNGSVSAKAKCKASEKLFSLSAIQALTTPGPQGVQGAPGPKGERGPSAFDTVPSGTTIQGAIGSRVGLGQLDLLSLNNRILTDLSATVSLPSKVPTLPSEAYFAPTDALDAACDPLSNCLSAAQVANLARCTGSVAQPTAPTGVLCVYLFDAVGVSDFRYFPLGTSGFVIEWSVPTPPSPDYHYSTIYGTWAFTVP